jgi:predicted regulator of Ras-like GTPase activity (Roadblock/LC7/MglB family)
VTSVSESELSWLLVDFASRVPEIVHALAVSADGITVAHTGGAALPQALADQLGAIASGLAGLLAGAAKAMDVAPVRSNLTEMDGGFLFSMAYTSEDPASLLVLATHDCDVRQVSYEMAQLIDKVGPALTPVARSRFGYSTHTGVRQD